MRRFLLGSMCCAAPAFGQAVLPVPGGPMPVLFGQRVPGADRELVSALRDERAPLQERIVAAIALRGWAHGVPDAAAALRETLADSREPDALRRECAKSLAWGLQSESASLLEIAEGRHGSSEQLRAIAFKSMFRMTGVSAVRDALEYCLSGRSCGSAALRGAAAWAGFKGAGGAQLRAALLGAARDRGEDESLRSEALKSLFGQMGSAEGLELALGLAEDRALATELRETAVLSLISRRGQDRVRRALEALKSEPELRVAAMQALYGSIDGSIAERFHLDYWPPNYARDPLASE